MVCTLSYGVASMFILASLFTSYSTNKMKIIKDFMNSLNKEQQETYKNITNNRMKLYLTGLTIGLIASLIIIFTLKIVNKNKKSYQLQRLSTACLSLAITFTFCYFYYILSPKGKYMITELETEEQVEKWLKIYKHMQFRYHAGFALGLVGVAIFSQSFCN